MGNDSTVGNRKNQHQGKPYSGREGDAVKRGGNKKGKKWGKFFGGHGESGGVWSHDDGGKKHLA